MDSKNSSRLVCKTVALIITILFLRIAFSGYNNNTSFDSSSSIKIESLSSNQETKFLEVPQIVWGLNNQKIALARACLTAKFLNRTLLMPSLSASLFYKEIDRLQPIAFDKVFNFDKFNHLCKGFVQLGQYSDVLDSSSVVVVNKGSGRKWTTERDLQQLNQIKEDHFHHVIRIVGKNPFLWHDHWPVKDYARVFECLRLVDDYAKEAEIVVSKIREVVASSNVDVPYFPYIAVHMRIEIDWMIHCRKLEQRLNINQICSSKNEILDRVGNILELRTPSVVYLAVADSLLNESSSSSNSSILNGWKEGLIPIEKKKLGVDGIYNKYPYLIQSAIDYEVCLQADVFVGNSFSTFSSLIALERTQKMIRMGVNSSCGGDVRWPSYAYNVLGESNGAMRWMTNMSDSSLKAVSYGSNLISCSAY